jgi:hypothetical protein
MQPGHHDRCRHFHPTVEPPILVSSRSESLARRPRHGVLVLDPTAPRRLDVQLADDHRSAAATMGTMTAGSSRAMHAADWAGQAS